VGRATRAALNVPVECRIDAIRVNLERARWVLRVPLRDLVLVDIAGFHLHLYRGGRSVWTTRVVVGRAFRKTPVFRSKIRTLVLNPTWTVPEVILEKDILPAARRDPGFVARRRLRVIDRAGREVDPASVDWSRYRSARELPYQLRQAPGPGNPLGRIKFLFPNEHAVYLHDTPDRTLFAKAERAASSGCIRVEEPLELAVRLLADPERWSREALEREIATGRTETVRLGTPLPVVLMYWTVDFEEDGSVVFRRDLYGRDARVLEGLEAEFAFRRPPIPSADPPPDRPAVPRGRRQPPARFTVQPRASRSGITASR
jgi:L,D-transpeptidase YcbB